MNSSTQGMLTTRIECESAKRSAAASAVDTSDPVAISTAPPPSRSTYPPRAAPPSRPVRSRTGTPWRVPRMMAGRRWLSTVSQASTISPASAGRNTAMLGMARMAARCSMGWWVGPSSPRNTDSWVKTQMEGMSIRAESRTAGRM